MRLLSKIYKRSVTICMVVIIALAAGIYSVTQMSVTLLPDIGLPFLGVSIVYPGASSSVVEQDVTVPLEAELNKISNVDSISVTSIENASIAVITYDYGVDLEQKKDDLKERLANLSLPDSCYEPSIVEVDFNGTAVATVSVYNPSADLFTTLEDAKVLQQKFTAIEGVGSVSLIGAPENKVLINPINGLEMTSLLLVEALGLDALDIPIGQITEDDDIVLVRNVSSATSLEELSAKPISITLGTTTWDALASVKAVLVWYEESTTTELDAMKSDIDGILEFIAELEDMDNDELDRTNDNLALFSGIIGLVRTNSSTTLRLMWNEIIEPRVEDPDFQNLTDEEIDDLATDLNMSGSLLRWIRDNSVIEEGESVSNIEKYWTSMVDFRKAQEDLDHVDDNNVLTIDDALYCDLFYDMQLVKEFDSAERDAELKADYLSKLSNTVALVRAINFDKLNEIIQIERKINNGDTDADGNEYTVSDAQYASIFTNASLGGEEVSQSQKDALYSRLSSYSNVKLNELYATYLEYANVILTVEGNTVEQLNSYWINVLQPIVSIEGFAEMTDEELSVISQQNAVDKVLLSRLFNCENGEYGVTASQWWNEIVNFRYAYESVNNVDDNGIPIVSNDEYAVFLYDLNVAHLEEDDLDIYSREELTDAVSLARAINTVGLDSVVTTLKEENDGVTDDDGNVVFVSNSQYAYMFANTEYDENLPMTATTIELIRSEYFEENWAVIYAYKQLHQHAPSEEEITALELGEDETPPAYVYEELSSADLFTVYQGLTLENQLPITLTLDLTEFLWTTDFSTLVYASDINSTLNTTIGAISKVYTQVEYDSVAYQNNFASLTLEVYTVSGANQTKVSEQVKEIIAAQSKTMDSAILLLDDQSAFITDSINNVVSSMIIGGLLAIIVILLFLRDFRTSIIIGITMPLSVLCSLACLYFMGISLNMVSLGGLAVGIGMLVDNGIVVIESIALERDKGKTAYEAAVSGTQLVVGPLIASTLTSICVFFPILFTNGLTKEIFSDLSWAVIFSLSFSLIVAITVIPALYCLVFSKNQQLGGRALKNKKNGSVAEEKADLTEIQKPTSTDNVADTDKSTAVVTQNDADTQNAETQTVKQKTSSRNKGLASWVSSLLDKILPALLNKRWIVVAVAIVLFASSVLLVFSTGMEFLPPSDKGIIEVNISYLPTQDIYECRDLTLNAKQLIADNVSEIDYLATSCSKSGIIATSLTGTITIQLKDTAAKTSEVVEQVRELLAQNNFSSVSVAEIDGVVAVMTSGMSGLSVSVTGDDTQVLAQIADEMTNALLELDYVRHVQSDLEEQSTEYVLNIDKNKCVDKGIDYSVLVQTLYVGVSGISPSSIKIDNETLDIEVVFADGTLANYYEGLQSYVVSFDSDGNAIKLNEIAEIEVSEESAQISRQDGKYVMSLSIETYGIDTGTASDEILVVANNVLSQEKYAGYLSSESGVNSYLTDAFEGLVVALIVSFFLLFAVMACQFESLVKPFIIIFSIPFAFTGGFLAIVITGTTLNVVSFIGLIMLMGVVVNNAIIMIERITQFTQDGMDPFTAIVEGTKSRVRPILMTTLTTVMALLPLALGLGSGADLMQPLGIVVIGGLTLGTLVTLVFIPVMYALIRRIRPAKVNAETDTNINSTVSGETTAENATERRNGKTDE